MAAVPNMAGVKCAKYSLFIVNIIVIILACATLGVGIWMSADVSSFLNAINPKVDPDGNTLDEVRSLVDRSSNSIQSVANVLITAGVFALLVGLLGCWAAYRESKVLLMTYVVILSLVVLLELGAGIAFSVSRPKIIASLASEYAKALQNYDYVQTVTDGNHHVVVVKGQPTANATAVSTTLVNAIQTWAGCCGGPNGYLDFKNSPYWSKANGAAPVFCCLMKDKHSLQVANETCLFQRTPLNSWMLEGCPQKIGKAVREAYPSVIGTAVGIGLINIFGIAFAAYMYRVLSKGYQEFE